MKSEWIRNINNTVGLVLSRFAFKEFNKLNFEVYLKNIDHPPESVYE